MRSARALAFAVWAIVLMAACTSGQTQVRGLPDATGATGVTSRTGPTGPTATGTSGVAGGEAFSLDFTPPGSSGISEVAFFTCNGLEGTWHYIFKADFGQGIDFDVDAEVDMAGGDGTLVFGGQLDVPDLGSISFTDTVELRLVGTDALEATSVRVEVDTNIPGFGNFFETFREGEQLPIVPGSDRC
ncbi:MAG: hypothetical protein ACRDHC_03435 [Actinomycetota bacterium]